MTSIHRLRAAKLRMQVEPGRGRAGLAAQCRAHAWHSYHLPHQKIMPALADNVGSVFAKASARAYRRMVDEISTRDPG